MIRISGIVPESIVDGPGLRYVVFTQGCPHKCKGCHNPETHDPAGGYDIEQNEIIKGIEKNPLLDGITLSGGEPFMQSDQLVPLAKAVKDKGLSVMIYSGFTFEELITKEKCLDLLKYADILVDGKFEIEQRSLELLFRGSKNQRIIDVKKSLKSTFPVLFDMTNA